MNTEIRQKLGIEFPIFAFTHCRDVVAAVTNAGGIGVLGGSIVGQNASELISVLAVAVTGHLRVADIVESMLVHPTLSEALAEAAE